MSIGKRATCIVLGLLCLVAAGASAQEQGVAEVVNNGRSLQFFPLVEHERLVLSVTGPCNFRFEKSFSQKEVPVFELSDETIDGRYRYDLVVIPTIEPEIIKILRDARRKGEDGVADQLCRDGKLPGAPTSQSHGFLVSRGEIIFDLKTEERRAKSADDASSLAGSLSAAADLTGGGPSLPAKDFVINDDLIVDGSACIGFDCVNGESFGFDTVRLKENNLRIKFDDTSTAAAFPRNDWQLTANDSANGGASKFSIDDISNSRTPFTVEANARSHSLYVDDGGRIGSRTSTPSVELHTVDGDTPALRLQQDGSSGFAPQTWDVAGNETNFFVRDVTNGSTLPFRIRPGAPSSAIFIDVDGDVGMGTSSPDEALHVERTSAGDRTLLKLENNGRVRLDLVGSGGETWFFQNDTGNLQDRFAISLQGSGGTELQVHERLDGSGLATLVVDGSVQATNVTFSSSRALKTEIAPISSEEILEAVARLPLSTWRLKTDGQEIRHLGPMAEDFSAAFGLGASSEHISVTDVNGVTLAAIQGLLGRLEQLEVERASLEERIRALEAGSE